QFIKKSFFKKTFYENFYHPLDLLKLNNRYNFYFAWQGTFKAKILNQYNLRFTHGIYHEDHDFGTILFCLAKKVFYINTTLMIYRIRKGSIINIQTTLIPQKLPKYLEPLKEHFNDYKELRKYFKLFCFIKIAEQIQNFNNKSKTNSFFLEKTSKEYMYNYLKESKQKDPLNIRDILQNKLKYFYLYNFLFKIRFYLRHPRKIFQDRT
ncbi:glycosyl transferase family A, partial [Campylobacter lari]|nr:glycosyl transferase family A [Campylobacter lari]